jgi:hypothetical protein
LLHHFVEGALRRGITRHLPGHYGTTGTYADQHQTCPNESESHDNSYTIRRI